MKTFFDEPDELIKNRIPYREYKNPQKGEGCCPIKNTYDEKTRTIEVECFPFVEKWEVTFKDVVFTVLVNKRYHENIEYNGKFKKVCGDWVSDLYIKTDREDIVKVFKKAFADSEIYTEEYLKKINENDKFETFLNLNCIEKIPKKDVDLQEYKELFYGVHWNDDILFGTR